MKEEFRSKFRNISRIMDCVTCEKCRLWAKLQILGLGTAIKILLTNEQELSQNTHLSRQEIVSLINTLNQFAKSVEFTSDVLMHGAATLTFEGNASFSHGQFGSLILSTSNTAITVIILIIAIGSITLYLFVKQLKN